MYLLYGGDDAFIAGWLAAELRLALRLETGDEMVEVAKFVFSPERLENCLTTAYHGNLFSSRQVVLCAGFDVVTSLVKAKSDAAEKTETLLELFADPPPSPVVFYTGADKLDERKKLTKRFLSDKRAVVISRQVRRDEWLRIAKEWAGNDLTLSSRQWERLEAHCAGSLAMLRQEIDKLSLFAYERGGRLDDTDFDHLSVDASGGDVFAVVRLVLAKRPAEAIVEYRKLPERESLFALLALLARQYRLVARVHLQPEVGDQAIARATSTPPYGVKVAREQAARVTLEEAEMMLARIQSLEFMIKSGQVQERSAADWFFLKLFA